MAGVYTQRLEEHRIQFEAMLPTYLPSGGSLQDTAAENEFVRYW